jgi:DnaD/phage-associated family protein
MNYEKEVYSFYDWLELNGLSPSAINLWHALLHINCKAGWQETFTVAESVLCNKTELTDRTLRKVRNELKQKGLIDFTSRKGKAPVYKVYYFHTYGRDEKVGNRYRTSENISSVRTELGTGVRTVHSSENGSALFRQKQIDKQTGAIWADLENEWRRVFGFDMKPNHGEMLESYIHDDQMSESLILEAIERVTRAEHPGLNYLWKILTTWANLGIKTIKDLVSHEKKRSQARSSQPHREVKGRDIPEEPVFDYSVGEDWQ